MGNDRRKLYIQLREYLIANLEKEGSAYSMRLIKKKKLWKNVLIRVKERRVA
jgi:hypothetical protein